MLRHSPGLAQGPRETDGTLAEYNKENKRSHTDRGNNAASAAELVLKALLFKWLVFKVSYMYRLTVNLASEVNFMLFSEDFFLQSVI